MITSNLLSSKSEVRRMIKNKGIKINNEPVEYRGYSKTKFIYDANDPSKNGKVIRIHLKN